MPKPKATAPAAKPRVTPPPKLDLKAPKTVVFPVEKPYACRGDSALKEAKAREYLGWTELSSSEGKTISDIHGTSVHLSRNLFNRPVDENWCKTLAQMILNKQWEYNRQSIQIGKFGNVVDGAHRLIALVFAEQMRTDPKQKDHWESLGWKADKDGRKHPITLETLLIEGVDEDADATRTIGYARPRSDGDVVYCDQGFFRKLLGQRSRKQLCIIAGNAVRVMWDRTGRKADAYSKDCTPPDLVDFLRAHPTLEDSVKTVNDANEKGAVAFYAPPGAVSAYVYMMGCSTTSPAKYRDERSEKAADMDRQLPTGDKNSKGEVNTQSVYERACEYLQDLASGGARASAVKRVINKRIEEAAKVGEVNVSQDKVSTVLKGWNRYLHLPVTKSLTESDVRPSYVTDPDNPGAVDLDEFPHIGDGRGNGIDLGNSADKDQHSSTTAATKPDDVGEEEAQAEAEAIREEAVAANGGAVEDESPEQERKRREELEARTATTTNGKPPLTAPFAAKKPTPKPKSLPPEDANRAAVAGKPKPKAKTVS